MAMISYTEALKHPAHDLSNRAILLAIVPLLTYTMPPGLALICLVAIVTLHVGWRPTYESSMEQTLSAHQLNYKLDPYTRQRLDRYRQLSKKKNLSKEEDLELDTISGSLLLTVPAPILPLKQFRLDIVTLAGSFLYQFYRLCQLFPETMNILFFKR